LKDEIIDLLEEEITDLFRDKLQNFGGQIAYFWRVTCRHLEAEISDFLQAKLLINTDSPPLSVFPTIGIRAGFFKNNLTTRRRSYRGHGQSRSINQNSLL
jgi:hypothetical protein